MLAGRVWWNRVWLGVVALSLSGLAWMGSSPAQVIAQGETPSVLYSTYLGGNSTDEGKSVALDAAGNIYVMGETFSERFLGQEITISGYSDIFVAKFDPTGSQLLYLKIIGSFGSDSALSLRVDGAGNAYGLALVSEDDFPTTANAPWAQPPERSNGAIFKLDSAGEVVYSTYLPLDVFEGRHNLAVDSQGNAYVGGTYGWVQEGDTYYQSQLGLIKLSADGSRVLLDRHYGGEGTEAGSGLALDAAGNIYLTGTTAYRDDFPVTSGAHQAQCGDILDDPDYDYCFEDGVIVVMDAAGEVLYASFHGGSFSDEPRAIAADGNGNVVIAGNTTSGRFPLANALISECPIDPASDDCYSPRGFISALHIDFDGADSRGTLLYSTYLGGTDRSSNTVVYAAAMDAAGNVYVTGYTNATRLPLQEAVQPLIKESFCYTFSSERYCFDSFVLKFDLSGTLRFGTFMGATFDEYGYDITVDPAGAFYLVGTTEADDFATTSSALQPVNQLNDDAFLVKFSNAPVKATTTAGPTPEPTLEPTAEPVQRPSTGSLRPRNPTAKTPLLEQLRQLVERAMDF